MGNTARIAIVGAGPAGMYATGHLIERLGLGVEIDLFDQLPTPWGLVRSGVAPDHPERKRIIDNLFDFYLRRPNVRFFGNVDIGRDVAHADLCAWYDAVVYTYGATDHVRMGIAGEELPGNWSAREFVAWYNGHPACRDLAIDLSCERAVVVGNGNVALDVARMLTRSVDELARTDIADHALAALRASRVNEVVVLGRRGPLQSAFSCAELEELASLDDVAISIEPDAARGVQATDWPGERKTALFARLVNRAVSQPRKRIVFRFLASPVAVGGEGRVERLEIADNRLESRPDGSMQAVATGGTATLATGLVFRAIGYRGTALAGLPFDARSATVANVAGRVTDGGKAVPGVYVAGWVKRGPRGIIGSNKKCADETVRCLLTDLAAGALAPASLDAAGVVRVLAERGVQVVDRERWFAIDRAEVAAGRPDGRPRVKFTDAAALLRAAGA